MITLTEKAAQAVLKVMEEYRRVAAEQSGAQDGKAGAGPDDRPLYLRVAVTGGGCGGFQHALDLADTLGENDEVFEQHGVKLICDPKSCIYLDGSTIDFKTTAMSSGFVFDIPTAAGRCGCGQSFSV